MSELPQMVQEMEQTSTWTWTDDAQTSVFSPNPGKQLLSLVLRIPARRGSCLPTCHL